MSRPISEMPIGIFDSGLGGLTVLKELRARLPNENFIYLGDTARVPYGNKGEETIIRYSIENSDFLVKKGAKLIVVACNTASSIALMELENNFKVPVLGVVKPAAKEASECSISKSIGVIGTKGTIKSGAYVKALEELSKELKVFTQECPLFVPLVEEGWENHHITKEVVKLYLKPLKDFEVDTLILGCTHYPLLKKTIQNEMGKDVKLIESGLAASKEVEFLLNKNGLSNKRAQKQNIEYFVTDDIGSFYKLGKIFMNDNYMNILKVDY